MPMKRTSMEKIREIIRIKEQSNLSERAISRALKISRPVVKQYLTAIENADLDYSSIKEMSDAALLEILSEKNTPRSEKYKTLTVTYVVDCL